MNDERPLDQALKDLAGSVEETLSVHPDGDLLLAHHRGELAPREADALEEHLAWCRECAALFRDAGEFAAGEAEPADPEEKLADWRALRARLAGEVRGEEIPGELTSRPEPPAGPRRRYSPAIAAVLAFALGGAGLWIATLNGRLEDSRRPQANTPIIDLSPPEADRTGESRAQEVDPARSAILVLNTRTPLEDDRYRVLIVDPEGRTVWTVDGLAPQHYGTLNLQLPPGSLEPGDYDLILETGDGAQTIETFRVRVLEQASASGP